MKTRNLHSKRAYLVANGDLRLPANQKCWAAQSNMESALAQAFRKEGWKLVRAHPYDARLKHGFIDSQKRGLEVFRTIDPEFPLVVAESVWQYSQHILPGLHTHRGPILTVANWSGTWPGLVGMLNLNGSLTKMGVPYSSLWSEDFTDAFFRDGLKEWLQTGRVTHDQSHVRDFQLVKIPDADRKLGQDFARRFRRRKAILGVFDEGCMGMHNAIVPDEILNPTGVFKERLSQSTLFAGMRDVSDSEAKEALAWYRKKGLVFRFGSDEATDLTERQVLEQCKMYIAAVRLADEFGCSAIGIQY
ncbi:MAG: fucose isomerase, partial [Verrucomicrobia bacterium]|nr:fucose isomerase [Verrucomicrobiota bacterium]